MYSYFSSVVLSFFTSIVFKGEEKIKSIFSDFNFWSIGIGLPSCEYTYCAREQKRRVEKISLSDELLKEEKAVVEELIKAAFNDAERRVDDERDEIKRKQMSSFNQPFDHGEESR